MESSSHGAREWELPMPDCIAEVIKENESILYITAKIFEYYVRYLCFKLHPCN